MSTKPATVALWDTNHTNVSAPTGSHITDGYVEDETPTSMEFNYQLNLIGQWCQYLNDGDIGLNNVIVGGTLNVTGASTQSTVHVTGTEQVDGALTTNAITANGLITANAGLTAAVNQSITVSGTGKFKHGTRTLIIPALAPQQSSTNPPTVVSITAQVSTQLLMLPIVLGGQTINASGVRVVLDGAAGSTFVAKVWAIQPGFPGPGTAPSLVATSPASSGASTQSLTVPVGSSLASAGGLIGFVQYITVERTGGGGTANVYWAEVDYVQL